ncbi:MAG: ribosome biogenesis GTPase Der [Saprospiraceae bacterium]
MGNIVAIVGRPNVGKSTFFNRLIGGRRAIVDDTVGVTRDRQYGTCEWNGKSFTVIDTGGFVSSSDDVFESAIRAQVNIAMEDANVIVFMVDVTTGVTDLDEDMARMLRRSDKPSILVVNKVDNQERYLEANEFYSLGFEGNFFISSLTGSGTGDLLDAVTEYLEEEEIIESDVPKFAIVGQPNVGKSSLVNALLGEERNIVTDIAGTTRDTTHSRYSKFGKEFLLIDTAGIRRKAKVHENLEFYSVMRAISAIEEADVCLLMIDAGAEIEHQDLSIFKLMIKRNKGVVVLVNKWDTMDKETNTARDYEKKVKDRLAPFNDVPIVFTSVTEKQRIFKAIEAALAVYENKSRKIKTSALNAALQPEIARYPPPSHRNRFINIKYMTQLPAPYPAFIFYCNHPKHVKDSYRNFLENKLRKHFDFSGVPITIFFREK